jgi:hypothetical protein
MTPFLEHRPQATAQTASILDPIPIASAFVILADRRRL